jgi:nucleoside phosphorylase
MGTLPLTLLVPTQAEAGYLKALGEPTVCGVGGDAVRQAVEAIASRAADRSASGSAAARRVVLAGFAGGLIAPIAVGDVMIPEEVVSADAADGQPIRCGKRPATGRRLVSVNDVVTTAAGKRALGDRSRADIADMEGHAFAAACVAHRLDWLIVRAVSDEVSDDLPEPIGRWVSPDGRTQVAAALAWAGLRPARYRQLQGLKARADLAGAALAKAVAHVAERWPDSARCDASADDPADPPDA